MYSVWKRQCVYWPDERIKGLSCLLTRQHPTLSHPAQSLLLLFHPSPNSWELLNQLYQELRSFCTSRSEKWVFSLFHFQLVYPTALKTVTPPVDSSSTAIHNIWSLLSKQQEGFFINQHQFTDISGVLEGNLKEGYFYQLEQIAIERSAN